MKINIFTASLLFSVLALAGIFSWNAGLVQTEEKVSVQSVCYLKCPVELEGRIDVEVGYGPPGFGDTPSLDSKINIPMLVLEKTISLDAYGPFEGAGNQKILQIETSKSLAPLKGQCVLVSGRLRGALTATDISQVVVVPDKIELCRASK